MILNELSIEMRNLLKEEIKAKMSVFLNVCHELIQKKEDRTFYYTEELLINQLCEGYSLHDWFKDTSVIRKERDFFRSLINRGVMLKSSQFLESEMYIKIDDKKNNVLGCLAAYEWDHYVVSLSSDTLWLDECIHGKYSNISDGEYTQKDVEVRNCSKEDHVKSLILFQNQRDKLLISSGIELWNKREQLFPHLIFCESVKKQLEEARVTLQVQTVINRIQILEDYFSTYNGRFDKEKVGYGCRYESETVQKDERLSNMRKFRTPYGKDELFYWHISFSGDFSGRIHFFPDSEHNIGIIGYVGKHLPTSQYSTI